MVDTNEGSDDNGQAEFARAFEWDDANIEHIARHGIEPWEAEDVILEPQRYIYTGKRDVARRLVAVGKTAQGDSSRWSSRFGGGKCAS